MGMFDHIVGKCPSCGAELYEQTKAGDCCLNTYTIEDEMDTGDAQIVKGEIFTCECGKRWEVVVDQPERVKVRLEELK